MKFLKYLKNILILLIFNSTFLYSQVDTNLSKNFILNFSVPDFPAFKVLGIEPSNLLKPSSSELISFLASQVQNHGNFILPNSYATEFSPFLLFNNDKITLKNYTDNHVLYSLRVSAGTNKDTLSNQLQLGLGIRVTIIDKGDLRLNGKYRKEIYLKLENLRNILKEKSEEYKKKIKYDPGNPESVEMLENYLNDQAKQYDSKFEEQKKEYQEKNWNKQKLDLAIAILGNSPDSLSKIKSQKYSSWITAGFPLGQWGQIFLGGSYEYSVPIKSYNLFFNSRIYSGINSAKGFVEFQYAIRKNELPKNLLINLGTELKIPGGFWVSYYAGLDFTFINSITTNKFDSHFDLRYDIQ